MIDIDKYLKTIDELREENFLHLKKVTEFLNKSYERFADSTLRFKNGRVD